MASPLRQTATERRAPFPEVLDLDAIIRWSIKGHLPNPIVGYRNLEAVAERLQCGHVHLFLLVGDVHALAGLPQAITLNRLGEDHRGLGLMADRGGIGSVYLDRIMPPAP